MSAVADGNVVLVGDLPDRPERHRARLAAWVHEASRLFRPPARWAPRGLAAFAAVTLAGLFVPFGLLWAKTGTGSRWRPFGRRSTAPAPCDHSTTNWLPACLSPFLWFGAVSSFSGGKRARRQRCVVRTIALMLVPVLAVDPQMVWAVHAEALAYQALATAGLGQTSPNEVVVSYDYDGNGNLIGKTTNSGGTSTAETYVFDAESRLASFQPDNAGPTDIVAYTYDFDGIRNSKAAGGAFTRYITDKNRDYAQVLEERNASGALLVRYVYGHDLISQTRDPHGPAPTTHYFHYDGQLSTRMLTDGAPGSPTYGQVTEGGKRDRFVYARKRTCPVFRPFFVPPPGINRGFPTRALLRRTCASLPARYANEGRKGYDHEASPQDHRRKQHCTRPVDLVSVRGLVVV